MSFWSVDSNKNNYNFGVSNLTSLLGEYSSIKSGGYKKLLDQYYKENPVTHGNVPAEKVEEDSKEELLKVRSSGDDLKKAASSLTARGKNSLFEMTTVKTKDDETGEEIVKTDYDRDAISKAVNAFVKGYNDLLDSVGNLNDESLLKKGVIMTSSTAANRNMLAKVGISIGKDNKLSVDEDKLKNADINSLKSLFNGSNTFAQRTGTRAEQMSGQAVKASDPSRLYGMNGKYSNYSSGNFYNKVF